LNACWRHVGALNGDVKIHTPEPFVHFDYNGVPIKLYRDVDITESHLMGISPADMHEIKKFCGNIRKVKNLTMPVTDIRGVKTTKKRRPPVSLLISALSALVVMNAFSRISRDEYIKRFKHEGIREMLRAFTNEKTGVVPIFFTMGTLARGDGGFPEGGSLPFAGRMADTFTQGGGKLLYRTKAVRVVVEGGKAVAVEAVKASAAEINYTSADSSGDVGSDSVTRYDADAVIVASDTMVAGDLFDMPLKAPWMDEMLSVTQPTMATFISLGIDADLRKYPKSFTFRPEHPISISDQSYEFLSVNNYSSDPVYSPDGKSALTIILDGDTYGFWKPAKNENRYSDEKQKTAANVISALSAYMPEIAGKIEVCDVATPLTYERYCGNWKGSWMTEMTSGMKMKTYPSAIKGLSGVYFAGQRMMPPGGLPVALMSGRTAVQYLCRDTDTVFVSEDF
jgi:phytoene dehydrogenase-like protein